VQVVNAVWNGSGFIKRKVANHYVADKRAAFLDTDCKQLVLDMQHPANVAAAKRAAFGYNHINAGFKWFPSSSDGATVMMTERSAG
jgi:hypothetical protein